MALSSMATPSFDLRDYFLSIKLAQTEFNGELNLTHIELCNDTISQTVDIDSIRGIQTDQNEYTIICQFDDEMFEQSTSNDKQSVLCELFHSPSTELYIDMTADMESADFDSTFRNVIDIQMHTDADERFNKPVAQSIC